MSYRRVVLTFPEQLCIPFHNHSNQKHLYSGFMVLAEACLSELIRFSHPRHGLFFDLFASDSC
ncbi:hypothetical protein [Candidatus Enterovibrio escicola]|uniref:hypothetical protein n=1 Tax=Candidatus Enterovibrio escicola TaxID=1927127 RepID=UPI001237EB4F|nr:hypothetical protein [Candidatus Enterovibrio escacola]